MENKVELGSEFSISLNDLKVQNDDINNYLENYEVSWFDYGRSAIKSIPYNKDKLVLLPEYICESVINCFDNSKIRFYKIDSKFNIDFEDLMFRVNDKVGCVYIAHYFGFLQNNEMLIEVKKCAQSFGITVVEDMTQSLFSKKNIIGDYAVASIRKWMPTPMGAVLYTEKGNNIPIVHNTNNEDNSKAYGMILKDMYLKTGYDVNLKYRAIFSEAETRIDNQENIKGISDFARFLMNCQNISLLMSKRKRNAARLEEGMKERGIKIIRTYQDNEIPLAYPLRVQCRDQFRKFLMDNRIYCSVHWPFDGMMRECRENAVYNSQTLISLPIDQRYDDKEIDYLLDVINRYEGEL